MYTYVVGYFTSLVTTQGGRGHQNISQIIHHIFFVVFSFPKYFVSLFSVYIDEINSTTRKRSKVYLTIYIYIYI